MDDGRLAELEAQVAELTATIAALRAEQAQQPAGERRRSRRGLLTAAGAAAAGATVLAVGGGADHVAAANNDPMLHGSTATTNNQATGVTRLQTSAASGGAAYLFQAGNTYVNNDAAFAATLAGWSETAGFPSGVYGYTETTAAGFGLVGWGQGSQSSGAFLRGTKANLVLEAAGMAGPARGGAHVAGELVEDGNGALWLCVKAGTPGTWRKIAGNETAGAFHPIAQIRVYDSRVPAPDPGRLGVGDARVVSVKDQRDQTGAVVGGGENIPAGATAVVGNITVTGTAGAGGYLTIMPGDAATPQGSSINWFGSDQDIANAFTAKLDVSRQLKIFCGGPPGPSTHVIVDISGYYL